LHEATQSSRLLSISTMTTFSRLCIAVFVCASALFAQPASAAVSVSVMPGTSSVRAGTLVHFAAAVFGTMAKGVTWSVNGIAGGNALVGTIAPDGQYVAPRVPPTGLVTIQARSVVDPSVIGTATITVLNPVPSVSAIVPASVAPGPFSITVDGSGFVPTSVVRYAGTAVATTWISPTRLTAAGTAVVTPAGMAAIAVANGDPGAAVSAIAAVTVEVSAPAVSVLAAARFLEQTSWGPDAASIARVQRLGFAAYLDEQFALPATRYPAYAATLSNLRPVQQQFVLNALTGPDQLRQRVAFALGQIFVVSGFKEFAPQMMVPWLELLSTHAFSDYATLLRSVTLNPTMGNFLDMANNEKASPLSAPNENYAREMLQLFTIGTERLNADGTTALDEHGQPIPTYDEAVVANLARALTGWTYPTRAGQTPLLRNPLHFSGVMVPVPSLHDSGAKTLLDGETVAAGQGPERDLDAVLDQLRRHPNVAPFLARRLIQQLVMSNPSPAYVERVTSVFTADHAGARGDLRSVVRAIVLDPEARRGDIMAAAAPADGHLREPLLYALSLLRTFNATLSGTAIIASVAGTAGQTLFYPPSVFNYFSPLYDLPEFGVRAPEFQLLTPSAAVSRMNLAHYITARGGSFGIAFDLSPFEQFAANPALLVEAANRALLAGRMSPQMRATIESAVTAVKLSSLRAETALYLVASSSDYQVQP